ncbi:FAD-dependent oxidoreductase, partial [Candidatus Bathyarchaeota archaeon]|nr:FAD-dependent oxidoreductase [Candidatus Bathyarchaeota archaeon]
RSRLEYDRLVVAAGSRLVHPIILGLKENAFSVDTIDEAVQLDNHLKNLAKLPPTPARNTVVVCGGGFTGIEVATELSARLRTILGRDPGIRVIVVERAETIGPDLGPGPRPAIIEAFQKLDVETRLGSAVIGINDNRVTLASGERIDTLTAIWTGGMAANALTDEIPEAEKDNLGRLRVDRNLRVPSATTVFAAGDAACAATDDDGHNALMSCQHAMILGRTAGNNAAEDLFGGPMTEYSQKTYVTCLDLGPAGAVVTKGWDREVVLTGEEAKKVKQWINTSLIYPPQDGAEALAAADPKWEVPELGVA